MYRTCLAPLGVLAQALLPRRCHACQVVLDAGSANNPLGLHVCNFCFTRLLAVPNTRCTQCGLALGARPTAFGWTTCRHCRCTPDSRFRTWVCADYKSPIDHWVTRLKYADQHALALFLGDWLGLVIRQNKVPLPDVLVPVPSSANRLALRGYNQAHLIASRLGKAIARPVDNGLLKKVRDSRAQADLGLNARLENLKDAFRCVKPVKATLRVGLVDDVITTGATLKACANVLYKAGVAQVDFFAICRVPE